MIKMIFKTSYRSNKFLEIRFSNVFYLLPFGWSEETFENGFDFENESGCKVKRKYLLIFNFKILYEKKKATKKD